MSEGRSAFMVACDDIRQEMSGKLTMIGIYQSDMVFAALPATLPQLRFMVVLKEPKGEVSPRSRIIVSLPGEETHEFDLEHPPIPDSMAEVFAAPEVTHVPFTSFIQFNNLQVSGEGRIVVYVETPTERLRAGSVRVSIGTMRPDSAL